MDLTLEALDDLEIRRTMIQPAGASSILNSCRNPVLAHELDPIAGPLFCFESPSLVGLDVEPE